MTGLDVTVKCPVCGEINRTNLGGVAYILYKGGEFTDMRCSCGVIFYFDLHDERKPVTDGLTTRVRISMSYELNNLIDSQVDYCLSQNFDLYKTIDYVRDFVRLHSEDTWLDKYNIELTAYIEHLVNDKINENVQVGILYSDLDESKIAEGGVTFY